MEESKYGIGCIVEILLLEKIHHVMLCSNPYNGKLSGVSLHDGNIGFAGFNNVSEFKEMMQVFDILNVYKDLTEFVSETIFNTFRDGDDYEK